MEKFFNIAFDMIESRRPGKALLRGLSYFYQGGVALRNLAYDRRWLKSESVGLPVISVGNIVAGGTGKTPFVKFLATQLMSDFQVAILSRGYRSFVERSGQNLQVKTDEGAAQFGDEPLWLAKQLPRVQVWVGKDRITSAKRAQAQGAQVLILDDGMQHRKLKRDFEMVLMNGDDLWGKGFFLPRGFLRDSPQRLKKADLIVVTGDQKDVQHLAPYSDAPIVSCQRKIQMPLHGKKVALFCAIASPDRFVKSVEAAGGEVVAKLFKSDHTPFSNEEIQNFAKNSRADAIICTEKDHVKLPSNFCCDLPLIVPPYELEITGNISAWNEIIEKIYKRVKNDTRV